MERWTAKRFREYQLNPLKEQKGNKFGAVKQVDEHGIHDSTGEQGRFHQLLILQRAGRISGLERQVWISIFKGEYYLCNGKKHKFLNRRFKADAVYFENGKKIVEDFKGDQTAMFRMKWQMAIATYPEWVFRKVFKDGTIESYQAI